MSVVMAGNTWSGDTEPTYYHLDRHDFLHKDMDGHHISITKSLYDILEDEHCPALLFVLEKFNALFAPTLSYTVQDCKTHPEACLHVAYFGFIQHMTGALRVSDGARDDVMQIGAYIFALFKSAKQRWRDVSDVTDHTFIDRLLPLIKIRIPDASSGHLEELQSMYALVMRCFKDMYRHMTSYDGKSITYVTHLKEVMLTMLFSGDVLSVDDLIVALGHDLVEDIEYIESKSVDGTMYKQPILSYIQEHFRPSIVFAILQLSKPSVVVYVNRLVEDAYMTKEEKKEVLHYQIVRTKEKKDPYFLSTEQDTWGATQYYHIKGQIREAYVEHIEMLAKLQDVNGYIYFDTERFEILDQNNPVFPCGYISFPRLVATKACDVCNNLATLHQETPTKIKRKVTEAKRWLLLVKQYAPTYLGPLEYWIRFWS